MEINWITDVVVPLGAALIGGTLALIVVLITLSREKKELKNERIEKAKPVLINYLDDAIDRSELMPTFVFKATYLSNRSIFFFLSCLDKTGVPPVPSFSFLPV